MKAPRLPDCFPGVQYFFSGRYLQTNLGLENPTPAYNAIHDFSQQERGFAYMSAFVDPTMRVSLIAGTANNDFQIPNNPATGRADGIRDERVRRHQLQFGATQRKPNRDHPIWRAGAQKSENGFDGQLSYFTRYNDFIHAGPDRRPFDRRRRLGRRASILHQRHPGRWLLQAQSGAHGPRGFVVSGEQAFVGNSSLVEPCMICDGSGNGAPETITDDVSKLGWLAGVYAQDEWKVTDQFTINAGLRFDQMGQFVNANQISPRVNFVYKPFETRRSTLAMHAILRRRCWWKLPRPISDCSTTRRARLPASQQSGAARASHHFDAGVDQNIPFGCS